MDPRISHLAAQLGYQTPELTKALSSTDGFAGYNLEPWAKLMLPFFNGLRNRTPVDSAARGALTAEWKVMMGFPSTFDFSSAGFGKAEAATGTALDASAVAFAAPYATQPILGGVNLEAVDAAREFDDPFGSETATLLAALFRLEEMMLIGGNYTALVDGSSDGAALAVGTGSYTATTYYVVTALTYQGCLANAAADTTPSANVRLGESAGQRVTTTSAGGSKLKAVLSWDPVPGALGYKIYAGSSKSAATLVNPATCIAYVNGKTDSVGDAYVVETTGQQYVTVTSCEVYGAATGAALGSQTDGTANTHSYEGYVAWAQKNTMYGKALGSNHVTYDCAGQTLTPTGSGIAEIDAILQGLWVNLKISPTLGVASANTINALTNALMGINSGFTNRIDLTATRGGFTGGAYATGYVNKFAGSMIDGTKPQVDFWAHPEFPDGTILFLTEKVPYAYSRESRGFALDVRRPYTYWDLARTTISYPFSLLVTQTLKCYHPAAQASITGLRVA